MSSGNTQFFLPQRSWQRGQSGRNAVRPDLFKNVLRFMQVQILLAQGEGLPTIPPPLPVLTVRPRRLLVSLRQARLFVRDGVTRYIIPVDNERHPNRFACDCHFRSRARDRRAHHCNTRVLAGPPKDNGLFELGRGIHRKAWVSDRGCERNKHRSASGLHRRGSASTAKALRIQGASTQRVDPRNAPRRG